MQIWHECNKIKKFGETKATGDAKYGAISCHCKFLIWQNFWLLKWLTHPHWSRGSNEGGDARGSSFQPSCLSYTIFGWWIGLFWSVHGWDQSDSIEICSTTTSHPKWHGMAQEGMMRYSILCGNERVVVYDLQRRILDMLLVFFVCSY